MFVADGYIGTRVFEHFDADEDLRERWSDLDANQSQIPILMERFSIISTYP
jgi:hypothetical protein